MGMDRGILAVLCENNFSKAEDPKAYAKLASQGMLLGHPVKIKGQDTRHDNNIPYHTTIKFFDPTKDKHHEVHNIASKLNMNSPNPKEVQIRPHVLKDRLGNDVYAIQLHGPHAEEIKEHHKKFSHMGHKENYEFTPHISVPKSVHDEIKASGARTAHDAGIEFGHAELKQGPKALARYKPKNEKLAASEDLAEVITNEEPLLKPYVSEAQRRWAHTDNGKKALGGNAGVHEWDEATKGKKLPERIAKSENGDEILEKLSEIEHEQWMEWSKSVASEVSEQRKKRWEKYWIPYKDLTDEVKEQDRKYAKKVLNIFHSDQIDKVELINKKPSKLDLKKGSKDISTKNLAEIQEDTAWTWASRAAACYEKLKETGDWKWKTDAEEYRHEAVEHAALIGDTHPTVLKEIHDALEDYRIEAQKEAKEINKSEKVNNLSGDDLRRYIEDNPEFKEAFSKEK